MLLLMDPLVHHLLDRESIQPQNKYASEHLLSIHPPSHLSRFGAPPGPPPGPPYGYARLLNLSLTTTINPTSYFPDMDPLQVLHRGPHLKGMCCNNSRLIYSGNSSPAV